MLLEQAETIAAQAETISKDKKTISKDKKTIARLLKESGEKDQKIDFLEKQAAKPQDSALGARLKKLAGNEASTKGATTTTSEGDSEKAVFMKHFYPCVETGSDGSGGSGGTDAQQEKMNAFHKEAGERLFDLLKDLIPGSDALQIFIDSVKNGDPSNLTKEIFAENFNNALKFNRARQFSIKK